MSNIFLQHCNFEKIVRFIPQVTAMLPHQNELTLSPPTISKDQMPLSKILASNAIFWPSTLAPWLPVGRGSKSSFVRAHSLANRPIPAHSSLSIWRLGRQRPLLTRNLFTPENKTFSVRPFRTRLSGTTGRACGLRGF